MSQKFASLERRIIDHVQKKYPAPLHQHFIEMDTSRMREKDLKRKQEEKRLFQIISKLPNWGVGRLFVKVTEPPFNGAPNFWRLTGVQVDHSRQDLDYGVAFGIHTERGYCTGYQQEITMANEELWRLVPKIEEKKYLEYEPVEMDTTELPLYVNYPPLLERMLKAKELKEGCKAEEVKHPMMRLQVKHHPFQHVRQRLEDGTLV